MAITITPVIQLHKKNAQGKAPLAIRITIDRKNTYQSIGHRINPDHWDADQRKVSSKVSNHALINSDIKQQLSSLERKLLEKKITTQIDITIDVAKKVMRDEDEDFLIYAQGYIDHLKPLLAPNTIRAKNTMLSKMKAYSGEELSFRQITPRWLEQFESYMLHDLENEPTTVWGCMKFIRAAFNRAVKIDKITKHYPFDEYKLSYKDPLREYLEQEEVQELWELAWSGKLPPGQTLLLKYFLLGCYTGMRLSDLQRVHDGSIIRKDKIYMLDHKTGGVVGVPINSRAKQLADDIGSSKLMTGQKANEILNIIRKKTKIAKHLHMHLARHTFAVIFLELGGSLEDLQRFLGHGSIKSTAIYGKITNKKLDQSVSRWEGSFK